jgi:hypothetical protein
MGRKMTAEQKKKISEANKKRHAEKRAEKEKAEAIKAEKKKAEETQQTLLNSFMAAAETQKAEKRITKNKCHRHPDINVKLGGNCEKCIGQSRAYDNLIGIRKKVLPCPKCNGAKREEEGGTIKTFYSKRDHYGCGKCSISYNIKGEVATWDSGKDQALLNKELRFRGK